MLTQLEITLAAKVLGHRQAVLNPHPITITVDTTASTLADLLAAVVAEEVAAFHERQAERQLLRLLSPPALARAAESGKIVFASQVPPQTVDVAEAVATARQAFADGIFFVFLDQHQVMTLDQPITLHPGSELLFVRLVALIGG